MDMSGEPMFRDCAACRRGFAVEYEFAAPRVPSITSDRVHVRGVRCPTCRYLNPVVMPMYVHRVTVASLRPTRTQRIARQLTEAAIQLLRPFRPFLP
jgi:hypothetical protein